jgi:acetamidase/formamidase
VHVKGGFLYVGDCHAAQGDGELSGVAIEQRATVTMQIDVIKGWSFAWPRLETKGFPDDDRQRGRSKTRRASPIANWFAG